MSIRVLISSELSPSLREKLITNGFEPITAKLIKTVPVAFDVKDVLKFMPDFVVISSKNGVKHFFLRVKPEDFKNSKFIAVGSSTAKHLRDIGISAMIPKTFNAEGVVELIKETSPENKKFLIVRPKVARNIVPEYLRRNKATVKEVIVYETKINTRTKIKLSEELKKGIDIVVFTSPSNFKAFLELSRQEGEKLLANVKVIPIGNITSKAILKRGFKVWKLPDEYTMEGIVRLLTGK